MKMTPTLKARENRLRRQASRRGLRIVKAPGDLSWGDLGAFLIMRGEDVIHVVHHVVRDRKVKAADWKAVLDDIEAFLLIAGQDARG
jgi:hypothetical protein